MQTCASDIHARISKTRTTNPWNKTPTHSYFPYIVPAAPTLLRNVVHLVRTRRGKPTVHHFGASFLGGGQFLLHSFNFHAFLVVHALWTFACALRLLWLISRALQIKGPFHFSRSFSFDAHHHVPYLQVALLDHQRSIARADSPWVLFPQAFSTKQILNSMEAKPSK